MTETHVPEGWGTKLKLNAQEENGRSAANGISIKTNTGKRKRRNQLLPVSGMKTSIINIDTKRNGRRKRTEGQEAQCTHRKQTTPLIYRHEGN